MLVSIDCMYAVYYGHREFILNSEKRMILPGFNLYAYMIKQMKINTKYVIK